LPRALPAPVKRLSAAEEGGTVSLAVFALVVVIWAALLIPLARRGRAELAAEASKGRLRLSSGGARPWTTGDLPEPPDDDPDGDPGEELLEAAARLARRRAASRRAAGRRRRMLLVLAVATAAGLRAWAGLGGRWWLAAATAGALLAAYLLTLAGLGWRRTRRRRALTAAGRAARGPSWAGSWGGPVAPSTE
jgi:hypothetical protein